MPYAATAVTAIASEVAAAGVDVVAHINPVNGGARRVLQKVGVPQAGDAATGPGQGYPDVLQ